MMRQGRPNSIQPFYQLLNLKMEASLERRSPDAMIGVRRQAVAIPA
jgi:hypothetical protein